MPLVTRQDFLLYSESCRDLRERLLLFKLPLSNNVNALGRLLLSVNNLVLDELQLLHVHDLPKDLSS